MTAPTGACVPLLLAACSGTKEYLPEPAALQERVDCSTSVEWRPRYEPTVPAAKLPGNVPPGFVPVDVVPCRPASETDGDSVPKAVIREEHLSGDYAPLLAALAIPSDQPNSNTTGTSMHELLPPDLWLIDSASTTNDVPAVP